MHNESKYVQKRMNWKIKEMKWMSLAYLKDEIKHWKNAYNIQVSILLLRIWYDIQALTTTE